MKLFLFTTIALTPLFSSTFAQIDSPEAVYLRKHVTLEIISNSGHLDIQEHHQILKKFYRDFENHLDESVYYSEFDNIKNLSAATILTTNSGDTRKVPVSEYAIVTEDVVQSGVFYGGIKRKHFAFPKLTSGALGKIDYDIILTDPHMVAPFYFDDDLKVENASYSVVFPDNVAIRYQTFGLSSEKIQFLKRKNDDGTSTYTWTLTNIPEYHHERDAPERAHISPHLAVYIANYTLKASGTVPVKVLSEPDDLFRWYKTFIRRIPVDDDSELAKTTSGLISGKSTDRAKAEAIFRWVQSNIRYIAFENGMAGFIPRSASDVYMKRFGDCKDMANLLKTMLSFAGMNAHLAWIGTRSRPYSYDQLISPIINNHMVCQTMIGKDTLFLDATNAFVPFGMPSSMIQDKQAMIALDNDRFEIQRVPVVDRSKNGEVDSVWIQITPEGIQGRFHSILAGYRQNDLSYRRHRASTSRDEGYLKDFFQLSDDNLMISPRTNPVDSNSVNLEFTQRGYYKKAAEKIYINMNLRKDNPGSRIDTAKRNQPVESEYLFQDTFVSILQIPEGYAVSFMPKDLDQKWSQFGIRCHYRTNGNNLILERTIYSNFLYLYEPQFLQWNAYLDAINKVELQSVALTKRN